MTDAPAAATRAYMPPAQSVEWETPADLFAALEREFGPFELDPAATAANAKAPHWYGPGSVEAPDGLNESWLWAKRIYINPPYGGGLRAWVAKAAHAARHGSLVVMLLPARTDVAWFHDHVYQKPNVEVRFMRGRVRYGRNGTPAPFPSMIVVFRQHEVIP